MAAKKFVCKVCGYVHTGDKAPDICPLCKAPASQFEEVVEKKKGLDTTSNAYAIGYATVVVVIVAFLLAFVSSSLKERQDSNIRLDKMKQILSSLNIKDVANVETIYNDIVKKDAIINSKGAEVSSKGGFEVATDKMTPDNLPLYICQVDGSEKYVIPVTGQGLWGGIWGYVALNDDRNTIYGVYFSHQSETPGLGAEITTPKFTSQFLGKHILKSGTVEIGVIKGKITNQEYQVNSISGATITCDGVNTMLKSCLGDYKAFMEASASAATVAATPGCEAENVEQNEK